ncbi:MFS transporter [Nonomuraea angiospora]|uniref:Tetracycline resistance protein n=1 Tax=Nonomuraea angiospora TaxID=46172 RepID=A0ABR9M7R1_9ACTN|nr:MFS transporter [Nonomuraea angiospora]MBE1588948.1 MFS family permease [Nonomuraea angiospora]
MIAEPVHKERIAVRYLALLATPTSLSANSTTTVIPGLARALGVSAADATWAATAFGWGGVLGAPLTVALLRTRGIRAATLVNAALVLLGTLLVAGAPTLAMLLAGRAAQAAGGGGLITIAITLAGTASRAGSITAGVGLVGAFGPLAGSTLSAISWRVPLLLSLPALLAVPAVLRHTPAVLRHAPAVPRHAPVHHRQDAAARTDTIGILLVMTLVSAFVLIPRLELVAVAAAAVAGLLLTLHVRRTPAGFIPQPVVRTRAFVTAAAAACTLSTSYFALLYTVPRLLEHHWTTERIGLVTLIMLATGSIASLLFTRRAAQLGPAVTRSVLPAAGATAVALASVAPWPVLVAASTAFAVFATTAAMAWYATRAGAVVPQEHRATAVSLFTLCYQLGGAFGPALATFLLT